MSNRLAFGILGPLEVRRDGARVPVGGPRQRALLALMLCNANRVVSRDRLVDELMSGQASGSAERVLQVQVSRLRKALSATEPDGRVLARPPGYVLRVEDGELDLHEFERRLAAARLAIERDDPAEAAALLRGAEALWRGRPLADLEFEPFARLEIQRLEELRLLAVEERIDAELALGRHAALCPELDGLVAEHPLRERLRRQFMLALYRSGRQAEALGAYQQGRSLLVDELALEPGLQLRGLERAILQQDADLELPAPLPARPTAVAEQTRSHAAPASPQPKPDRRRRPGRRWAQFACLIGAAIAAVAILSDSRNSRPPSPLVGNGLALVSPHGGTVVATVALDGRASDVAAGFGSVWVAEAEASVVVRVDQRRHAVRATIPVGVRPSRIAAAGGMVWVLDGRDGTLSAIDPGADTVRRTVTVRRGADGLVASGGSLWVLRHDTAVALDPGTGLPKTPSGSDPAGLATRAGDLWVADQDRGTVSHIDARTGAILATARVGDPPAEIASGAAGVWVLNPLDAAVSRVDPHRGRVEATLPLAGAPDSVTQSGGYVWVGDKARGTLWRIDPRTASVTRTLHIGGHVRALAAAGGVWVAFETPGSTHRGGTLTSVGSAGLLDTIDPAASTSWNVAAPQEFGLTNDGLVTLNHVGGPDGTRLVPDLALRLPGAREHGRSYTFHLRRGIHYSTGTLVTASDVTHSFERLFAIRSSGASLYRSIVGAGACSRMPRRCDLSRGIVADDRAGTATFHLTRPDPNFLYKLTIAYADVLPATTPNAQARTPLPATGPYMIATYRPGEQLRLIRNQHFREWSAAAQPAGNPDTIVIALNLTGSQAAAAVAAGKADFSTYIGQLPTRYKDYFLLHHRDQVRVNPFMGTNFLFLNMNVAPFNDVRVRRAINFALDRSAIVKSEGGSIAGNPTCQVLPPGMPGYRPYCPYTRNPGVPSRWHGPDVAKAKRLVAASGTKGTKVTVWSTVGPQPEQRATVATLKRLGYRASLRLLAASTYYTYTNDSRNRAQIISGGWSTDYPTANDFLGKLTCGYFIPGDGLNTTNASEHCDRAFDAQVDRAASLETSAPQTAHALWAQLDRHITDLAIWLPTITPNDIDLVSRRVANHYSYHPVWGVLLDQLRVD